MKRVFGTGEVSENSSLEKIDILKLVSRTVEDAGPYKQYIPFIESFLLLFFKKEEKNPNTNYLSTNFPNRRKYEHICINRTRRGKRNFSVF